jgi:UDP-N-acetylglucosamine 1-carboxyvinyltransferase
MDKLEIEGGARLSGEVVAGGSKNASLPILFASMLTSDAMEFSRVPDLRDIVTTMELLRGIGAKVDVATNSARVEIAELSSTEAPYDLVRTMRASILMLGPLLARARKAKVSLPGGCAIGARPVDLHLSGLEKMGAIFRLEGGYVIGECPGGLRGARIPSRVPSVGATENLLMAASLADGETILENAAREPEIVDLARLLRAMGADISGEGESEIRIRGVPRLRGVKWEVMFDRIEAGTLLLAGPITGGDVTVRSVDPTCLTIFLEKLRASGVAVECGKDWMRASGGGLRPVNFSTAPYPDYPTDLQAQLMAFLAQVPGESVVEETIFENRFMHIPELNRMGAKIRVEGARAIISGDAACYGGATVMATDLRASASLVLAGLAARGTTAVRRIYHLDRGYEAMEKKLSQLGAKISRLKE